MNKLKIAVLFGGCSTEYDISLQSAYSVITHLDRSKYSPVLLGITPSGEWFHFSGELVKIKENTWYNPSDCVQAIISPSREVHGVLKFEAGEVRTIRLDAAMPVLHGKNGEDGTVQGLLELAGIPIVGCNSLCSALCMDKDKAHKIAHVAGVRIPRSFILGNEMDAGTVWKQVENIGYPLFIKPVRAGSSFGITKVLNRDELPAAVKLAFGHDDRVIIEENISGFEVSCAVLGNDKLIVGELGEIELADGFFDYKEKYTPETYSFHVPARISAQKAEEIKDTARRIYRALGCTGFARVDMFLTPSGEIIFNEVNTIPGFTTHSHYPHMLEAAGMTFEQVINTAIGLAVGA
ncbi:MAG: D-alanine--D-serine ligase VanG [Clostridiaceae bacterium]|nr:D-alanine--D-serine ligase VanG [Clostridiaceae bacterium]